MYKVEYLIIVDNKAINCTSIKALKNLIQSDIDFLIHKDTITYQSYQFDYEIIMDKVANIEGSNYFHFKLFCKDEADIDRFRKSLKGLKKMLSLLNHSIYPLWDDLSLYYSQKAYPKISNAENLMRKLLSKFMLINLGIGWTKDRVPTDVKNSINVNNKDFNYLQNLDFIQLSNFLFSENYPSHKEQLITKLKQAKSLNNLNIEEIKSLLPENNWEKFFEKLVDCDAGHLKKIWEELYALRCKVAHNNTFEKIDFERVEVLTSEISGILDEAILNLDTVIVPDEEKENVVENIVSNRNEEFGNYILYWREFEGTVWALFKQITGEEQKPLTQILRLFESKNIISQLEYEDLRNISTFRNSLVHGIEIEISSKDIMTNIEKIRTYIVAFKKLIISTEEEHLNKTSSQQITALYKKLKHSIQQFSDISIKFNKHYISFVKNSNILDIKIQQKSIKLWLNVPFGHLKDSKKITKDVSKIGHLGNGDYEIYIQNEENLDSILDLIKQSYEYNKLQ